MAISICSGDRGTGSDASTLCTQESISEPACPGPALGAGPRQAEAGQGMTCDIRPKMKARGTQY